MKVVPSPVSASKAASRARSRIPSTTMLPRHSAAVDLARRPRLQQVARADGHNAITAAHGHQRAAQHTRRGSGSRSSNFDAKISKPTHHRTKVGSWLENVDGCEPPPSTPTYQPPCCITKRRKSDANTTSPRATQIVRQPGSPRVPLADITPFVLAAESDPSSHSFDAAEVEPPRQQRSPHPAPNLAGAIDMLTADDARQLLLLSAQSNMSLAVAIRQLAVARIRRPPARRAQESYLADTFTFDEYPMSAA
jgi:hypothetical protein